MVKQRFGCIYRLTNLITKRAYIGKTIHFKKRMGQHKQSKTKTYLSRSIQKYGWDNFKKEIIIDDVPEEDLNNLEISYIEVENTLTPNGMNLTLGGDGTSGYEYTPEQREKNRQTAILQHANRDQFGCVSFSKSRNKYQVRGPKPDRKYIGHYLTKEKAIEALNQFNESGKILESDIKKRKSMGCIYKRGKRYVARYKKNKKQFGKTFNTPEECKKWLKTKLNF